MLSRLLLRGKVFNLFTDYHHRKAFSFKLLLIRDRYFKTVMSIDTVTARLLPMVSKWKEVGEALSIDEDHLDEIFTNNETDEACLQEMLEVYFNQSNFDHSWKEIEQAMAIANSEDVEC